MLNVKGLQNCGNSCFIDTVLMSMYGYSKSPFIEFFNPNWLFENNNNIKDEINDKNISSKDLIIRKEIQKILRNTMSNVLHNNPSECSILRNIIENFFRWKTNVSNNLEVGQQDVSEFYDRLLKIFIFEPITVTYVRQSKNQDFKIIKEKPIKENLTYISIPNDGSDFNGLDYILNPKWEDLGEDKLNWKHNKKNEPTYRWTRNIISSIKGRNAIVFHINRTSAKVVNGIFSSYKQRNKIKMPTFIKLSGIDYFLFSSIIHFGRIEGGHYITILYDKENYYIYDDLSFSNTIKENKIQKERILDSLERDNVMHFYYPV